MSAMTPDIPGIAYVVAILLALIATGLAIALVRFAEKLARFTESLNAFRATHASHRDSITALAKSATALTAALDRQPATTFDTVELVSEPCGTGTACCRGPLPEATSATDLPLIAPTPAVTPEEAAAAITRKATSRDRVQPNSVTQTAQRH